MCVCVCVCVLQDLIELGPLQTMATFGAITRESVGFSVTSCDGVFGMAFEQLDLTVGDSVMSRLVQDGVVAANVFSLCLGPTYATVAIDVSQNQPH
jgi:hypothetical protein